MPERKDSIKWRERERRRASLRHATPLFDSEGSVIMAGDCTLHIIDTFLAVHSLYGGVWGGGKNSHSRRNALKAKQDSGSAAIPTRPIKFSLPPCKIRSELWCWQQLYHYYKLSSKITYKLFRRSVKYRRKKNHAKYL